MSGEEQTGGGQYSEATLRAMQAAYGEGFLSPGGAAEVGDILAGLSLDGLSVLDFGCGVGGASLMLARDFGARAVLGVDLEARSLEQARAAAAAAGLAGRVDFRLVEPGPLPLPERDLDLVFSKDVICHIPDKAPVFAELFRVLRPGGLLAFADFVTDPACDPTAFEAWLAGMEATGLRFRFEPFEVYLPALTDAGFIDLETQDHSNWSLERCRQEIAHVEGPGRDALLAKLGPEGLQRRIALTQRRLEALKSGGLRHLHMRGRRPEG